MIDRYNLVDDAWNAVITGRLAAADFLGFVEAFQSDRDLAVWQAIAVGLRGLGRLVDGQAYAALQQRIADLVRPVVEDLGWTPTEASQTSHPSSVDCTSAFSQSRATTPMPRHAAERC